MLDHNRLANSMLTWWNQTPVDEKSVNKLGDAMYDLMIAVKFDQESVADGALGRKRARETARAIITEFMNAEGTCARGRFSNMAIAIIEEFRRYAEILPLDVSNTPADGPGHTHAPATTVQAITRIL